MTESARILVVDDDSQITRVLKTVLDGQGSIQPVRVNATRSVGRGRSARARETRRARRRHEPTDCSARP
jgi:CheY-like chemotaxis protein